MDTGIRRGETRDAWLSKYSFWGGGGWGGDRRWNEGRMWRLVDLNDRGQILPTKFLKGAMLH